MVISKLSALQIFVCAILKVYICCLVSIFVQYQRSMFDALCQFLREILNIKRAYLLPGVNICVILKEHICCLVSIFVQY